MFASSLRCSSARSAMVYGVSCFGPLVYCSSWVIWLDGRVIRNACVLCNTYILQARNDKKNRFQISKTYWKRKRASRQGCVQLSSFACKSSRYLRFHKMSNSNTISHDDASMSLWCPRLLGPRHSAQSQTGHCRHRVIWQQVSNITQLSQQCLAFPTFAVSTLRGVGSA